VHGVECKHMANTGYCDFYHDPDQVASARAQLWCQYGADCKRPYCKFAHEGQDSVADTVEIVELVDAVEAESGNSDSATTAETDAPFSAEAAADTSGVSIAARLKSTLAASLAERRAIVEGLERALVKERLEMERLEAALNLADSLASKLTLMD